MVEMIPSFFWTLLDGDQPPFSSAILFTSKKVHSEGSRVLYSRNCFGLHGSQPETLTWFLDLIGTQNASFLRHISIDFPNFDSLHMGEVTLQKESVQALKLIQNKCTNINTLELSLESTTEMEYTIDARDSPRIAAEALALADSHFRAISSLEDVIVNVYYEAPSYDLREEMRGLGWKIEVTASKVPSEDSDEEDWHDGGLFGNCPDDWEDERQERDWWEDYCRRNDSD